MYAIGIDIGGMSIKYGLVNEKGEILAKETLVLKKHEDQENVPQAIAASINKFIKNCGYPKEEIKGIGIGCAGLINAKEGTVVSSANLKWNNLALAPRLQELTGLPCKIGNDANVAALGEFKFGAGKEYQNLIMITLGTGVGGGVIIDGKILEGHLGAGAELGHVSLNYSSHLVCGCGRRGCLEAYASAKAIIRQTKHEMMSNLDSIMWQYCDNDINNVTGKTAFDAMRAGDDGGISVVKNYVKYLGEGILNFCNIFRPEVIVLSGGIANEGKYLVDPLTEYCEKWHWGYEGAPKTIIKIAELGYESGIIGAACLIPYEYKNK